MFNSSLLSHKSDHWSTPPYIYAQVAVNGYFDPCPLHATFDGLSIEWDYCNFVNPPFSALDQWVDKVIEERRKGHHTVLLMPARTDTEYFAKLFKYGCRFYFIKGRLKFGGSKTPAPFPCVLVSPNGRFNEMYLISRDDIDLKFMFR